MRTLFYLLQSKCADSSVLTYLMGEKKMMSRCEFSDKNMQRKQSEFNSDLTLPNLIHREHNTKGNQLMRVLSEITLLLLAGLEEGILSKITEGYSGLTYVSINIWQF